MGHPDGGFTGNGDGKFKDFETAKAEGKLLWEDTRKQVLFFCLVPGFIITVL